MTAMSQEIVDRGDFIRMMNDALAVEPLSTAVVTIDCHRGHLDPEVATMPVEAAKARRLVAATNRLLDFARGHKMAVIHLIVQNRILPDGSVEMLCNPFYRTVDSVRQMLTPDAASTIRGHNLVGSVQTQLMPELGPAPTDIVINTKRRQSIYRGTDLDITLSELKIDTVVLAGINTNTCVLNAAFDSLNRDLKTIVIADCVDSMYGDDLHVLGLQNIARCLGWVLTVDELTAKVEASLASGSCKG